MKVYFLIFLLLLGVSDCQVILEESLTIINSNGNMTSEYVGLIVYNNTTNMSIINITSEGPIL